MPEYDSTVSYRDALDHPGYKVGSDGTVWTCWHRKGPRPTGGRGAMGCIGQKWVELSQYPDRHGYLHCGPAQKNRLVHHLVLEAFVGRRPKGCTQARHLDGNRANNNLENLKWGTVAENYQDRVRHGRPVDTRGEKAGASILTDAHVREIRRIHQDSPELSKTAIGRIFGVHRQTISMVLSRKSWKHIE